MKKIIAVAVVALTMLTLATSAFALVVESPASYKNPPVFVSGLTISDAWMSGLTVQNWQGSLTNQAYAEGSYIWFIARISVSGKGDTDAAHMWDGEGDSDAKLTITGKDGCLNLVSANSATLAKISGMNVTARALYNNNNLNVVEATENKAVFKFRSLTPSGMDANNALIFDDNKLAELKIDAIYGDDVWEVNKDGKEFKIRTGLKDDDHVYSKATSQKNFYLHFMAITKSATEGICSATLKVNGNSEFKRNTGSNFSPDTAPQQASDTSYSNGSWYDTYKAVGSHTSAVNYNDTKLLAGDRSIPYLLYNTVNGKTYAVAKISGEATQASKANGWRGAYANDGSIYLVMNKNCDEFVIGFSVANNKFQGLVTWNKDFRDGADKADKFNYLTNNKTWDAAYYIPLMSNDYSNNLVNLSSAYQGVSVSSSELQAIFDFFGFAYVNPNAPTDADFLSRSGLVTTAEAKYNVANAIVTTPDTSVVIPKTGDATTSTGLIIVAAAILAAATLGFVYSKRAFN